MFSGMLLGAALKGIDPTEVRDPPPKPTPATFPLVERSEPVRWQNKSDVPRLQKLYSGIIRPMDVNRAHLTALNLDIETDVPAASLISSLVDQVSYWPTELPQDATTASYAQAARTNTVADKRRKDFSDRLIELQYENDAAIRAVTKTTLDGQKPPRIAYMRKFWEGLEMMSSYWDDSLDDYYETMTSATDDDSTLTSPKRARTEAAVDHSESSLQNIYDLMKDQESIEKMLSSDGPRETGRSDKHQLPLSIDVNCDKEISASPPPAPRVRMRYKGRRTGTGRAMPDTFRLNTIRAFVEATVRCFQTLSEPPRRAPVVQIGTWNLQVRMSAVVSRIPTNRVNARDGIIQGPILGVWIRSETDFQDADGRPFEEKSRLDQLREIGALLALAQERRRGRKPELKPGEGKWWTTKPRWGGGSGGATAEREDVAAPGASDAETAVEDVIDLTRSDTRSQSRRRNSPAMLWRELKCGNGVRDGKTEYMAIGKESGSRYDEVYLVSALNRHISILKLTVHDAYLDYLADAKFPAQSPAESDWSSPKLQRSKWFDLFDIEDRVQAFRALWAIMSHLTRNADSADAVVGAENPPAAGNVFKGQS